MDPNVDMQLSLTVLVGLLAGLCYSIPNPLPAPTVSGINDLDIFGWTPRPTQGPSMELMKKRGLSPMPSNGWMGTSQYR